MNRIEEINDFIENKAGVTFGLNKKEELKRLIFEILFTRHWSLDELLQDEDVKIFLGKKLSGNKRFLALKEVLLRLRYPLATSSEKDFDVYLPRLKFPEKPYAHGLSRPFIPRMIYIQQTAEKTEMAVRVQQLFPEVPVVRFTKLSDIRHKPGTMLTDMGKRDLYIVEEGFDFIKPCPCTKGAVGCNYFILNLGFGCPFDCSYCYLQHYANTPGIFLPANLDSFFTQAGELLDKMSGSFLRIGTGEFFDSLALDHVTGYSKHLVEFFRSRDLLFEFKTKSANVENLLSVKNPPPNIVVSWSVNPPHLIDSEEFYTATLAERLEAAKKIMAHGYKVAFHFDPIIHYKDWEKDYFQVVEDLFAATAGKIAWISLGTLRFYRKLKPIVEQRFGLDRYFYDEFILDRQDNKMRYPKVMRENIFRKMISKIREHDPEIPLYLCMESPSIWNDVMGKSATPAEIEKSFRRCF